MDGIVNVIYWFHSNVFCTVLSIFCVFVFFIEVQNQTHSIQFLYLFFINYNVGMKTEIKKEISKNIPTKSDLLFRFHISKLFLQETASSGSKGIRPEFE